MDFMLRSCSILDDEEIILRATLRSYTILDKEEISLRATDDIVQISTYLCVSRRAAIGLLCKYDWDFYKIYEEWHADEEKVRKVINPIVVEVCDDDDYVVRSYLENRKNIKPCPNPRCEFSVEFNDDDVSNRRNFTVTCNCSHVFCWNCLDEAHSPVDCETAKKWGLKINSGTETVDFILVNSKLCSTCQKKCKEIVDDEGNCSDSQNQVEKFDENEDFILVNLKLCSTCGRTSEDDEVNCSDSQRQAEKFDEIEQAEKFDEIEDFILVNSKLCSTCLRPSLEIVDEVNCSDSKKFDENKNYESETQNSKRNMIKCTLDEWSRNHTVNTDGYYECMHYQKAQEKGQDDEIQKERMRVKISLEKYSRHYGRFVDHNASRNRALKIKRELENELLDNLSIIHVLSKGELKFITEAWAQIAESTRVLKWAYAYSYYLPEEEENKNKNKNMELVEFVIKGAEAFLERLLECAEFQLMEIQQLQISLKHLNDSRKRLFGLTYATRNYFNNLVSSLENGL